MTIPFGSPPLMINRLPKEFRLPSAANGASSQRRPAAAVDLPQRLVARAARCIGDNPVAALGAAFVVGLIVGRVVKR